MCGLFQPICQVRFTNVATVRLKVHGERFEIACYKNKVVNWRSGVETDIQEVLQSPYIFTSISKGKLANNIQLMKAFNTTDINKITKQILDKGEFQVSKEERNQILESTFRDIVSILHEVTINPNTGHPLSRSLLENALKSSGFSVSLNEPPKKQALKALSLLQKHYPESIARCKMRLRVNFLSQQNREILEFFQDKDIIIEQNTANLGPNPSNSSSSTCTPNNANRHKDFSNDAPNRKKDRKNTNFNENDQNDRMDFILFVCPPNLFRDIEHFIVNKLDPPGTLQLITLNIKDTNPSISTPSRSKNNLDEGEELLLSKVDSMKVSRPSSETKTEVVKDNEKTVTSIPNRETCIESNDESRSYKEKESNKKRCLNCNLEFEDSSFYRKHFKSDFHVFNSKRKLQGLSPITQDEYHHIHSNLT